MATRRTFTTGAAALLAAGCAHASGVGAPVAETSNGKVRGAAAGGVLAFKAIPYGASTAGANRFMPPQRPQAWAGVRDCLEWGPSAPQSSSSAAIPSAMGAQFREFFGMTPDVPAAQSEGCLVLNIFTPSLQGKRPVMVWIHGGGFEVGTGSGARSNGTNLARNHDVVTVTINHRLGVLGYCDLSAYGGEYAHSGTVGQLDLVLALQWVRDNIERFGGDPQRVMIHGESGGGSKVSILLAMPAANGLFSRAICQSGVASRLPGAEQSRANAVALLREMQLSPSQLRQLREATPEQMFAAAGRATAGASPMQGRGFAPFVGGVDIPIAPLEAIAAGASRDIPLIVGCAKHEAALFLAGGGTDPAALSNEQVLQMAPRVLGPQGAQLIEGYRANYPNYTPGELLVRAMTDASMRFPSIQLAEAHVRAGGAPTFMYLFTWESPVLPHLHAAHGIDGTFYFGNTESVTIAAGNPEAQALSAKTSAAWAHFAGAGEPAAPGLPAWPRYSLENRETMIFSAAPRVENDPMREDRLMRERMG